ncbi:hypothetical protein EVAR_76214_1 [Eumeta japonica]|uniref:Uncharacterized protein n=1 Tax=Eumeta variegata TaxID=151549 RepID=A0A4C1UPH8_EUMVA|nr:hypothetical protein EVAR_76214_1 [Eumeta japonica]
MLSAGKARHRGRARGAAGGAGAAGGPLRFLSKTVNAPRRRFHRPGQCLERVRGGAGIVRGDLRPRVFALRAA